MRVIFYTSRTDCGPREARQLAAISSRRVDDVNRALKVRAAEARAARVLRDEVLVLGEVHAHGTVHSDERGLPLNMFAFFLHREEHRVRCFADVGELVLSLSTNPDNFAFDEETRHFCRVVLLSGEFSPRQKLKEAFFQELKKFLFSELLTKFRQIYISRKGENNIDTSSRGSKRSPLAKKEVAYHFVPEILSLKLKSMHRQEAL